MPFLMEQRPYLARCNMRLARGKVEALGKLAQQAVHRTVCSTMLNKPFRHSGPCNDSITFLDLPTEIRQQILGYTDLVAPENEVEWSPFRSWYIRRGDERMNGSPFHHLHPIAKDRSDAIQDVRPYDKSNANRQHCQEKLGGRGCFCKSRHTVYSSYSKSTCWAPPTPLFLVSSIVRRDALQVFFTRNRIVVWPSESKDHPWDRPYLSSRLPISSFLSDVIPKDALRHLQYLEIIFPAYYRDGTKWSTNSPVMTDWKRTIEKIKPHLVAPKLAIKMIWHQQLLSLDYMHSEPLDEEIRSREEEFLQSKAYYFDIVLPLQQLSPRLKHLFVCIYEDLEGPRRETGYAAEWSHELEKTIMGASYERPSSGNYEVRGLPAPLFMRTGRWYSDHECPCMY